MIIYSGELKSINPAEQTKNPQPEPSKLGVLSSAVQVPSPTYGEQRVVAPPSLDILPT